MGSCPAGAQGYDFVKIRGGSLGYRLMPNKLAARERRSHNCKWIGSWLSGGRLQFDGSRAPTLGPARG
jgi:hypothetical protein